MRGCDAHVSDYLSGSILCRWSCEGYPKFLLQECVSLKYLFTTTSHIISHLITTTIEQLTVLLFLPSFMTNVNIDEWGDLDMHAEVFTRRSFIIRFSVNQD